MSEKLGLYIHVPFCSKVCHYCDFAVLKAPDRLQKEWLVGIKKEWKVQSENWKAGFQTLYIGGGTPSILTKETLVEFFDWLQSILDFSKLKEISFEANPEHVTRQSLAFWKGLGVNRVSMGIQSLNPDLLKMMGRNHSSEQAIVAMNALKESEMNWSADLMFSLPKQSKEQFYESLEGVLEYKPQHVSFYGLSVEPQTFFSQKVEKGELEPNYDDYADMYKEGVAMLAKVGLERYEISNFSLNGKESLHNSMYWLRVPYLGLGPGAHSFNGVNRIGNPKHFKKWLDLGGSLGEVEVLTEDAMTFEKTWLGLRVREGVPVEWIPKKWADIWLEKKYIDCINNRYVLLGEGWLQLDEMMVELV